MLIVHACAMIMVRTYIITALMFDTIKVAASREQRSLGKQGALGDLQAPMPSENELSRQEDHLSKYALSVFETRFLSMKAKPLRLSVRNNQYSN